MILECIVPQSAGSLSVAALALIMVILQMTFLFRKHQFSWYGWSAALSFSSMLYALGVFLEYNTPAGSFNRNAGLLEFTAHIFLIQSVYGFTFAYLGIRGKRYHIAAGSFHVLIIILLWLSNYIVADSFVARHFIGLAQPFIEADLGPLGPLFELYILLSSIGVVIVWLQHKGPATRHKVPYLAGMVFWILLGIHDGLASLGMPAVQYVMEYGFLAFAIIVHWGVFNNYIDILSEDKYRVITEFANDGIMIIQDREVSFANPACNKLIGRPSAEFTWENIFNMIVPEDRKKVLQDGNGLLSGVDFPDSVNVRITRTDQEERVLEIRANSIIYRNSPAIMVVMRDITERLREQELKRKTDEKITRLKKMESLGLLAGGVAHDLNNVLSGIVSYPDIILPTLPPDSKLRKPIETMQQSGLRAAAMVHDLLTVARGVAIAREPLNLNEIIRSYLTSPEYKKLLHYHPAVTVQEKLDQDLLNINGSPNHLRKALMNLVSNAAEAIEDSGNVVISTRNQYIDKPLAGYDDVNIGEYVVLVIEDSGPGISAEDRTRIFEPFYTKKVMGRSGTGLGLTVVWNVVQDHEGYIDLLSDKHGSQFHLYFPTTRESATYKRHSASLTNLSGHGEMILVIDDLESQREISCSMLETLGYKAKAVSSGEEAVQYLQEHTVDLLLLDMIMDPGINGRETYERIKKIHPQQKAIIVSGFAETQQVKATQKLGAGRFVKKPLILEELGLAVQEELKK